MLRYWDGQRWTDHRHRAENPPAAKAGDGLLWAGVVTGLLLPIVGFIIAIVLFAKGRPSQGGAVLLCCVSGFLLGLLLLGL